MCCFAHDHCENIASGQKKYGLENKSHFTKLHCKCDKEFQECLRKCSSEAADNIGYIYFLSQSTCYMKQYKVSNCKKFETR